MILLVSLLFLFSLFSIVSLVNAAYDEAWDEGYWYEDHKEWFNYHYFNGTIIDKDAVRPMNYIEYLIDVNGTTFFLQTDTRSMQEFYIGDKVTIYGSAVNEERNMHRMSFSEFNGKYWSNNYNLTKKFPKIRVYNEMRLADGFVRGGSSSNSNQQSRPIPILKGTITNGNPKTDQTKCTIFVGKEHAGENVYIAVLYKNKGKNLNQGKLVSKKVSSSGKVTVQTANPLKKYPDKAIIAIYDSNKKVSDAKVAILSKKSKPQHFKFNVGKSFTACKNYCPDISDEVVWHMINECDSQGDSYLDETEFNKYKSLVKFTRNNAANKQNHDKVDRVDLWTGDGTTKTRYCADHGRVKVGADNQCPWCKKYGNDPRTKADSTKYV